MESQTIHSLVVYADAKVRGTLYFDHKSGRSQRTKVGEATAACVGYLGLNEVVSATVPLEGKFGPQQAEYEAVILGLANSLVFVAESESPVSHVLVCSDNAITIETLTGDKAAHKLAPFRAKARLLEGWLVHMGVEVHYEYVPRTNPRHKQAHQLSQRSPKLS